MPTSREDAAVHDVIAADEYVMPATQGQVRFWSLDQLNPGNPALNMPLMWQCTGPLDVPLLHEALKRCVERHEILRTAFDLHEGKLSQVIHPVGTVDLPLIDLTELTGEAQRQEADRLTREHAAFRMDLRTGPLLVLKLLRLAPRRHLLLVTMHHIICDGISNGVLLRDMSVFYEAMLKHEEPRLPDLPIQFADYAVWHEQWRETEEPAASLAFWRKTLGQDFTPLHVPHDLDAHDSLPDAQKDSTGDIETLLVPPDLAARAHAFCVRENVTFNILLFSVFVGLLSRLTGQRDLTIGSPCANRTEDTEELIGLFMNIQVMRVKLEEDSTFQHLLQQVQGWTLGACENQVLPFEDLVHDSFFSGRANSFEIPVFFLYQKSFMLTQHLAGLEIVPLRSESPGAVFEMMFAIVDREEEGPRLQLEYNPQHFKVTTVQRILRLYNNLLDSAITAPDTRVDRLDLLSAAEHHQLDLPNQTTRDFGPFEPVHQVFQRRAALEPERTAITCAGESWTNARLAGYARALAQRLVAEGLEPGGLVGICIARSPEMLGAVLAVMMAGGVYLPLDPRHPRERLEFLLRDSAAGWILTDRELRIETDARMLALKRGDKVAADVAFDALSCAPDSLAYVIYTSGSTGRPKGVAIEQRSLMNLLHSMEQEPGLRADDTLVAVTTLSFDIATLELLLPLLTGAHLVIATDHQVHNPPALLELLQETRATVMQATPGVWRMLLDQGWSRDLPLKVVCGGEALSRDLADKLLTVTDEVWNVYGPTETTIWSSATPIRAGLQAPRVGPPIANTQFYVLDEHSQRVPQGMVGELYIGGAGVARGYWNRPELTAERFTPNPFAEGRIYRTGDLARAHEDGTVHLLGRADFQVKVRGYRIELGEIESALTRHKDVREAVVVQHVLADRPGAAGITRLIAYVDAGARASESGSPTLIAELEDSLSRSLPDYMTPNAIVALPEMPRLPNGKLDRKALPDVFSRAGDSGIRSTESEPQGFVYPRDVIERQLTEIWQTTLGIQKISIRASFFSLGVGSLAALRLITRMNRVYGTDLGLASLITASTIESIAELIRQRFSPNTASALVPIQPAGTRPPLFIVHGVGGNVVNFYGLSMRMGADQPVYGIQSQALVTNQPALLRLKDMAEHYIREIRTVQPHGPYHLLGYSFGGTVVLEMAHQLRAEGEEVSMIGMLDSRSRDYDEERARTLSVQTKIGRRVSRFRGNTVHLAWRDWVTYIYGKVSTRAIRFSVMAAARLNITKVPAFMKSAYDINYVAVQNYKLRPYDGRLTLFRATEQDDASGPYDLGWASIFTQGVQVYDLPGDHERIFLEPNIDALATSLRAALGPV